MDQYKEAAIAAAKASPAWLGVYITHAAENITVSGVAALAATVYSIVQTYISIQRYRREK
ncbi:hypothetical protein [Paraburkholderia sp. BL9I2N2]|uniref:hypothetical protein n=1 Tax=Paraburkholderia sp. BL9I2N2 TaxID=1938809 RepID=UPI00104B08EE|nr:hypothetical protein [Paraburkholderia sp. BL9I2N2]